jgi:leucyl/phenylalanyl-tRNA--protein transferase
MDYETESESIPGIPETSESIDDRVMRFLSNPLEYHIQHIFVNRNIFEVTINKDFESVIKNCQKIERKGQDGTWISEDIITSYTKLHKRGYAKSFEVWQIDSQSNWELVGGLYGVDLGHVFCGESMFSKVPNASKIAFVSLIQFLKEISDKKYLYVNSEIYDTDNTHSKEGKLYLNNIYCKYGNKKVLYNRSEVYDPYEHKFVE